MALADADLPAWWARLGLPGLVDVHVHFMPGNVLAKVWAYFDRAGPLAEGHWPIRYRLAQDERVAVLRQLGVRAFPALCYPHRPGMATWLNDWSAQFCASVPEVVPSATFYPEPGAAAYVEFELGRGVRIFKAHLQVGAYDPRDPLLCPVWGRLAEAGVPVVVHAGSGPEAGPFTGPGPFGAVLAAHPRLRAIIAHLGMPEYTEFLDLAARYPNVHLDTTMAFTDFAERLAPVPAGVRARLADLGDRVVLGTDFPNIPYPYAHQLEALAALELPASWLRAVCYDNGARLLGVAH